MMNGPEKSDPAIVAMKLANKAEGPTAARPAEEKHAAESVELPVRTVLVLETSHFRPIGMQADIVGDICPKLGPVCPKQAQLPVEVAGTKCCNAGRDSRPVIL
jgi:hypothetical protein